MIDEPWFLPTAFGTVVFLQLVLLIAVLRLSGRVSHLFRLMASPASSSASASQDLADRKEATSEQKKWFAEFLEEDPSRRDLPKKEQFAAFRQWRENKGLNWKGPAESA
jgi:Na+-transporting methylmalonyl-CoA/oxaloacetate decarboxylase gamma subunit